MSNRKIIVGGSVILAVVLGLLLLQGEPTPARRTGHRLVQGNPELPLGLAEPITPETGEPQPPPILVPHEELQEQDALVPLQDLVQAPEDFAEKLFTCHNLALPVPIEWRAENPGSESKLFSQDASLLARYRLTLQCRLPDLRVLPVHAFFAAQLIDALPAIGPGTQLTLRFTKLDPAGNLLARYVQVTAHPQLPREGPPLLDALLHPDQHVDAEVQCQHAGLPQLLTTLDPEVKRIFAAIALPEAGTTAVQGTFAQLHCLDALGMELPVIVHFTAKQTPRLLQIVDQTRLQVRLRGNARSQLLATFERLEQGGLPSSPLDLRRIVLDPEHARGRTLPCTSLGLPLAQTLEAGDPPQVDDRKTWLVCGQMDAPPVQVMLFFQPGQKAEMLAIQRGTELQLQVLGVQGEQIQAVLTQVTARGTEAAERKEDLRRFALHPQELLETKVHCTQTRAAERMATGAPQTARRLFHRPVEEQPMRLWCQDPLRPFDGQLFQVFFANADERKHANLQAGAQVELQFVGLADMTPVAGYVAPIQ